MLKLVALCALFIVPAFLYGSLEKVEFSNSTGKTIVIFTNYVDGGGTSNGASKFVLKAGETHTTTGSVNWGWRFDPAEGKGPNTDGKTPCQVSVSDNEESRVVVSSKDGCYID